VVVAGSGKRKPPSQKAPALSVPSLASGLSEADRALLEREFAHVRPLRGGPGRVVPDFEVIEKQRVAAPGKLPQPAAKPGLHIEAEGTAVSGASYGVSRQTLRELRRGEMPVKATLDLHGLHAEQARHRLQGFVEESVRQGRRAVAVICGKGKHSGPEGPILRQIAVETLAAQPGGVLAFTSAAPAQGGDGVLLLLLRHAS